MDMWQAVLVVALVTNAILGVAYHVYRLSQGGPMADVTGRSILGVFLVGVAIAVAADVGWVSWVAVAYGLLFGLLVMPVWVLGVLIPMPPRTVDYAFTAVYWLSLVAIVVAGFAL